MTVDLNYIYKNKLNKVCFAHDTIYGNCKNLAKRIVSVKFWITDLMLLHEIYNMIPHRISKYSVYNFW